MVVETKPNELSEQARGEELRSVEAEVDSLLTAYDKIATDIQREPDNVLFINRLIFRPGILYSALTVAEGPDGLQMGTDMLVSKLLTPEGEGTSQLPEPEKLHFVHDIVIEPGTTPELAEKLLSYEIKAGLLHRAGDTAEKLLGRKMRDSEVVEAVRNYLSRGFTIINTDNYITSNVAPVTSNKATIEEVRQLLAA